MYLLLDNILRHCIHKTISCNAFLGFNEHPVHVNNQLVLCVLVCKFKAHKHCAVKAQAHCKWTTLATIGSEIIEDDDGV